MDDNEKPRIRDAHHEHAHDAAHIHPQQYNRPNQHARKPFPPKRRKRQHRRREKQAIRHARTSGVNLKNFHHPARKRTARQQHLNAKNPEHFVSRTGRPKYLVATHRLPERQECENQERCDPPDKSRGDEEHVAPVFEPCEPRWNVLASSGDVLDARFQFVWRSIFNPQIA